MRGAMAERLAVGNVLLLLMLSATAQGQTPAPAAPAPPPPPHEGTPVIGVEKTDTITSIAVVAEF